MEDIKVGTKIKDRYVLKEFKGSGSFGEVWLAHDEYVDADIALKIYISLNTNGVEEFKREYMTASGLSHSNLLTPSYFDVWEHHPYLVMKYCASGSSNCKTGNATEKELWKFIHDVASGLHYLHSRQQPIIHQDIKPDNILVDGNDFLITDFGISKQLKSTMRKQSTMHVAAGATAYMAPERFSGDYEPIKASDIWSLGVSIYELATGELPFCGMGGGMQKNGAELPTLKGSWSKQLEKTMQACLALHPYDRPKAEELANVALAYYNGSTTSAPWLDEDGSSNEEEEVDVEESNNKRAWIAVIGIAAIAILLYAVWPSNKGESATQNPVIENVLDDELTKEKILVPEVKPNTEVSTQAAEKTPDVNTKEKAKPTETTPTEKKDDNAVVLKRALANEDYQQVQRLANQGYAPAYVPLAKYYLKNNEYASADTYAKKAKAAGQSGANAIITQLDNLGYYD